MAYATTAHNSILRWKHQWVLIESIFWQGHPKNHPKTAQVWTCNTCVTAWKVRRTITKNRNRLRLGRKKTYSTIDANTCNIFQLTGRIMMNALMCYANLDIVVHIGKHLLKMSVVLWEQLHKIIEMDISMSSNIQQHTLWLDWSIQWTKIGTRYYPINQRNNSKTSWKYRC